MAKRTPEANEFIARVSQTRGELDNALAKKERGTTLDAKEEEVQKEVDIDEHLWDVQKTADHWGTDLTKGLSASALAGKIQEFGKNELTPPPKTPLICIFFGHLTGFFSLLLWAAAALCFIAYILEPATVENLYLGIVLSFVTLVTGAFSFYQDYGAVKAMEGFANFLPRETIAIRDGVRGAVPSESLVPGDIIVIETGNKIPADIRVIDSANFKVDNSSLTGENLPQKRDKEVSKKEIPLDATNLAFYGTNCDTGGCTGIVVRTGDRSVIGTIAKLSNSTDNGPTPIAEEISHFIHIVSGVAIFLGITFLIIGFIKGLEPVNNLVFAIGIIVANVPEGLLATVTVSLTLTAKRMATKQVLVKNLEAVETLGSTTVIASDKTGTLTQNIMTVVHCWYDGAIRDRTNLVVKNASFEKLRLICGLCNDGNFNPQDMSKPEQERRTDSNASDAALIKFVDSCDRARPDKAFSFLQDARENNPRKKNGCVPFSSSNKFMVTIHAQGSKPSPIVCLKGATERVLGRCDFILLDGETIPISPEHIAQIEEAMMVCARDGERVLGMAYVELDENEYPADFVYETDDPESVNFPLNKGQGLIFVGFCGLQDPPRPAVPPAVKSCRMGAGIKVIMVTGDHPETAEAIAKQVYIIEGPTRRELALKRGVEEESIPWTDTDIEAVVITGEQLLKLTAKGDEGLKQLDLFLDFPQIVFARTSPAQKLQIVQALQNKRFTRRGFAPDDKQPISHVVAVTGDGVNDSPALKAADIGVAMGLVGSDVAKDAADMILLNDDFASIVQGVEEGRLIFDNLKKSIAYTLSSNIPEISPFLVFILIQIPLPLPTVLILCIDLGTDMIPAISLAYEMKEADIMQKPPRDKAHDRLVTAKLINFSYLQVGMVQAAAGFYTYVCVLQSYGFQPFGLMNTADWYYKGISDTTIENAVPDTAVLWPNKAALAISAVSKYMVYHGSAPDAPSASRVVLDAPRYQALGECYFPGAEACWNPLLALKHAQTAFFIAIIVVQWADVTICKTRTLSVFTQGMSNNVLNFGLFFTCVLGSILCYVPGCDQVFGTAPLQFLHWTPAMPFCIFIFVYDEVRKAVIRARPALNAKGDRVAVGCIQEFGEWTHEFTYY